MKKIMALILAGVLTLSLAACTTKNTPEVTSTLDMNQSITHEQLLAEVNFNSAQFATAEDGEVYINTDTVLSDIEEDLVPIASFRSDLTPEQVWAKKAEDTTSTSGVTTGGISSGNFTLPADVLMSDGSLGNLSIPKIGLSVSIYETDDEMEAMVHGVAHFKETSCWDGNIGLAGHNQGVNTYFGKIHTLAVGDTITLTTAQGTRTYAVSKSVEISETDWSYLGRTEQNLITLITCVNHDLTKRLCVQATEVIS